MAGRRRAGGRHDDTHGFRLRRLGVATTVLALVAVLATVVLPTAWRSLGDDVAASGEASSLLTLLNQARANNGLAPLGSASDLTAIASARASAMARSGSLSHTPDLGGQACCWTWIAENVAYAGSVRSLHDVLMGSAPHRANILNASADDVGVAVVKSGDTLWAAQVFRARTGGDRSSSGSAGTSRDGDRTTSGSVTGGTATGTSSGTSTGTSTGVGTSVPTLSPAELARLELRQSIRSAREKLKADRRKGRFDPVRAAVAYAGTLDRVSH